jgi:predicted amidohydrolase YtcJ
MRNRSKVMQTPPENDGDSGTTLIVNADVRTMSRSAGSNAVAFRDGRILTVGKREDVEGTSANVTRRLDAEGATVLPGFIDAHQHPAIAALYGGGLNLTGPSIRSVADIQSALAHHAASVSGDEWVVGTNWNERDLAERRPPTRRELDDAIPGKPVFLLHYSCHRAVANGRALTLAGLDDSSPGPSGGLFGRDARGALDGLLVERGMSRVETLARAALRVRDAEGFLERMASYFQRLVACGVTRVCDAAVPVDLLELYREANRRHHIPIPTVVMPVSTRGYLEAGADALNGPPTGTTDGNLVMGPVKLVTDGAPTCSMCLGWWQVAATTVATLALTARHRSMDPIRLALSTRVSLGAKARTGILLHRREEVAAFIDGALGRGFSVASHAEGNDAVRFALSNYRAFGSRMSMNGTPRLEHVLFAERELIRRIAAAGVAVVAQPGFLRLPELHHAPAVPGLPLKPLRWLLDAGVILAGSSDFPVTTFDPLEGIRAAIDRRSIHGRMLGKDQALTLDEALAMYTRGAATALSCLSECGTLEAGKRADIVVLDRSLKTPRALEDGSVRATFVAGRLVHGAMHRLPDGGPRQRAS